MAAANPVTEAELEEAFRSDTKYGVEMLDLGFREQIIQHIKRETWGELSPDELIEVYGKTLLAMWVAAGKEGFDPSCPLRLVNTIARNKGIDATRARRRSKLRTNKETFLDGVASCLKDTEASHKWLLLTPTERREFQEVVLDAVQTLPERQKLVVRCYLECFETILAERSYRSLADAVSAVTGTIETVANVKSAWHAAKEKIASELDRRGFNLINAE
jgi:DNA-directed RNA polymerase specialized sigma24 family protein